MYSVIEEVINFLDTHWREQPDLEAIAARSGFSKYHFHRTFTEFAGITPKQFLQNLTFHHARERLKEGENVLNTSFDCGLSGSSRLHDLCLRIEAITPGELKRKGQGLRIRYGFHPAPLGTCLIGLSPRGLLYFGFVMESEANALKDLRRRWPEAELQPNPEETGRFARRLFLNTCHPQTKQSLPFHLWGTPFQVAVWQALVNIPSGSLVTYSDLAGKMGKPRSSRAVGNAVGANPIAWLIPCHRVIRQTGVVGNYHYGQARKRVLIALESPAS